MKNSLFDAVKEGWPVIATAAFLAVAFTYPLTRGSENISELGDWIGGIASAIAFLWLVAGYNIQRHELSLQHRELELQRLALQQQAAEMKESTKIYKETADATLIAAEAARKSADASELSAKALIGMELSVLHVSKMEARGPISRWLIASSFLPEITIKNFGRTPAFINDIIINAKVGSLPDKVEYKPVGYGSFEPITLDAKDSTSYTEYFLDRQFALNKEQLESISDQKGFDYLIVYGVIKYRDFLNNNHESGFAYFWSTSAEKFLFDPSPGYNYKS